MKPPPAAHLSGMKVLVTNDDGVSSPGLHALVRALVADGRDVVVAAPDRDMSGSGAAIGQIHVDEHIDARPVELPDLPGVPAYAVDGPPGLCVLAARLGGFGDPPDMVLSGINPGCNTGRAVLHSGTVGAALTAANFGGRGLAVSLDVPARLEAGASPPLGHGRGGGGGRGRLAGGRPGTAWCSTSTCPTGRRTRLAGARAATLAPFGTVRSAVVETAEGGGRLQMELRPTTVELPPDCDTALVKAGYVAVSAIGGIRIDDGVDVGGLLGTLVPDARRTA